VFNEKDKTKMLERGFSLLKGNPEKHIYIFANEQRTELVFDDIDYILSDMLTF
jgi:hypothetical protein